MTTERFNELLNGPLHHPMVPFAIMRLSMALRYVLEQTGEAGDAALEEWCRQQEAADAPDDDGAGSYSQGDHAYPAGMLMEMAEEFGPGEW